MTDYPIMFSAPMVRTLLNGRKTMTRRLAFRSQERSCEEADRHVLERKGWLYFEREGSSYARAPSRWQKVRPGDRLWCREAFTVRDGHVFYKAGPISEGRSLDEPMLLRCRPSIHMPRRLSRLTLIVTETKIERVQDMEGQHPSESDAIAEGINAIHHGDGAYYYHYERTEPHPQNWCDPADAFRELWDLLHGPDAWERNDEVVALRFVAHKVNIDQMDKAA